MVEILAIVFTFICVWLTTKNKVASWPVGIIGVILFLVLFFQVQLYAEVITQIVFLLQSFYGWYNWSRLEDKPPAPITRLTTKEKLIWSSIILITTGIMYQVLSSYTNASIPLVDSFTTSISLIANWLLAKRKLENWWLWIFVDLIYVGMFAYKMLYLTSGLYFVFFFMSIHGLYRWKEELNSKYGGSPHHQESSTIENNAK